MPWSELSRPALGALTILLGALALGSLRRPSEAERPGWDRGGLISLALCCGLALSTTWALAQTLLGSFGISGFLSALSAVFLAAWANRFFRGRELGIAFLLLGTVLIAFPLAAVVSANGPASTHDPIHALGLFLSGTYPAVGRPLGLLMLAWVIGGWVTWCALAEGNAAVSCALPMVVLVANLVNIPSSATTHLLPPVLSTTLFGLALMGWTAQRRQEARWSALGASVAVSVLRRQRATLAVCVVLLTAGALLLPPLNQENISGRFFHYAPYQAPLAHSPATARTGLSDSVSPGPALTEDPTPLLSFWTTPALQTPYLQAVVLTGFDSGDWYDAQPLSQQYGASQGFSYPPAAGAAQEQPVSLTVHYLDEGGQTVNDLLYDGTPASTGSVTGSYLVAGSYQGGSLVSVSSVVPAGGIRNLDGATAGLTTRSELSVASAAELEQAATSYPVWVRPLARLADAGGGPEELIHRYAESMAGRATNPYQIAVNIATSLQEQEGYTLDPPRTPAGTWPIVYFLTTGHAGYCQYFASAMGAMLRSLGIPTRLVNGFLPGAAGTRQDPEVVTESDAHTWVQVYFPSYGWITFDPTPGGAGGVVPSVPGAAPTVQAQPGGTVPSGSGLKHSPAVPASGSSSAPLALMALALLLLAVLAGGALLLRPISRSPAQLRRRLALLARLRLRRDCAALTLSELEQVVRELHRRPEDSAFLTCLSSLVEEADRLSFAGGEGRVDQAWWQERWRVVRRQYAWLLWQAWAGAPAQASPAPAPEGSWWS